MLRPPAVLLAVVLSFFALPMTSAEADGPTRILVTGDSITQGFHGDYTWRYRLAKEFARQDVPVEFVGSMKLPFISPGFTTSQYRDAAFDSDHFASVGLKLAVLRTTIHDEVAAQQPDVVVVAAGVNDIIHGATPEATLAHLQGVIDSARSARPDLRFIVSPVLDIDRANLPEANDQIHAYDALLRTLVPTLDTPGSPVSLASTTYGWKPANTYYTFDGIHPAPTGEAFVAQRIAEEMHRVGLLPQAPSIYQVIPWLRTLRPRVAISGDQATITWFAEAISGANVYAHHTGSSIYRYHPGGTATMSVGHHLTYTFRLRLLRARVWGPWGPTLDVTTP